MLRFEQRLAQRLVSPEKGRAGCVHMLVLEVPINEWAVEQGYQPFCHVVEVSVKRYQLELLADAGIPRVPSPELIIEFVMGMTQGDVEKGGSREARGKDWYASPLWGKSQAEMCMPLDKKGVYGWGPFKQG